MHKPDDTSPTAAPAGRRHKTEADSALGRRARRCAEIFGRRVAVDTSRLARNHSCAMPGFVERGYYVDQDFTCKDCGVTGVWTAARQRWWYEVMHGDPWTTARRCARCRRLERERIAAARRAQVEGERRNAAHKAKADRWQALKNTAPTRRRKRLR
ncbi:zinc-ribbon domain-containing protein [Tahibacter caeni]|uniref:zinc-ribbon domain-containing protein n=1 Tax=Tahibacter caeni TaxID=1453545 RepID=UPI002148562A|nr:zinc-ribbon domain-containing protein [Tahibacter caeni]